MDDRSGGDDFNLHGSALGECNEPAGIDDIPFPFHPDQRRTGLERKSACVRAYVAGAVARRLSVLLPLRRTWSFRSTSKWQRRCIFPVVFELSSGWRRFILLLLGARNPIGAFQASLTEWSQIGSLEVRLFFVDRRRAMLSVEIVAPLLIRTTAQALAFLLLLSRDTRDLIAALARHRRLSQPRKMGLAWLTELLPHTAKVPNYH